jgi:hypothetical protein
VENAQRKADERRCAEHGGQGCLPDTLMHLSKALFNERP